MSSFPRPSRPVFYLFPPPQKWKKSGLSPVFKVPHVVPSEWNTALRSRARRPIRAPMESRRTFLPSLSPSSHVFTELWLLSRRHFLVALMSSCQFYYTTASESLSLYYADKENGLESAIAQFVAKICSFLYSHESQFEPSINRAERKLVLVPIYNTGDTYSYSIRPQVPT